MLVRKLLTHARARLCCTGMNATLVQAVRLLDDGCNKLVVYDEGERIVGVPRHLDRLCASREKPGFCLPFRQTGGISAKRTAQASCRAG